jgi:AbrB family looped-hinge helix DNA binding protein
MSLDMASKVKNKQAPTRTRKRDGRVKITAQGQISIPRQVMRDAGIQPGDTLQATTDGQARIVLAPVDDLVARFAGVVDGYFEPGELERMRAEWDR